MTSPETYITYYQSPIGLLKISGTPTYISEISYHDTSQKVSGAKKNLPPLFINCVEQLIEYFNGQRRLFELPVNQTGTAFQQDVWNLLMSIPYGRTMSYVELARMTGDPKAVRAVANANGKNNIAIVIPCHRVIGSNKDLVGYMGGLWRKKWLLELEAKIAHGVQTLF